MMIKGELEKKMKKMIIISSVIVVLLLTMSIFLRIYLNHIVRNNMIDQVDNTVDKYIHIIQKQIDNDFQFLDSFASVLQMENITNNQEFPQVLEETNEQNDFITMMYFDLNERGVVANLNQEVLVNKPLTDFQEEIQSVVYDTLANQRTVSDIFQSQLTHEMIYAYGIPVYQNKQIVGALIATQTVELLMDAGQGSGILGGDTYAYLVDESGQVLVNSQYDIFHQTSIFQQPFLQKQDYQQMKEHLKDHQDITFSFEYENAQYHALLKPIGLKDWNLLCVNMLENSHLFADRNMRMVGLIFLSIILLVIGLLIYGYRIILKNNRELQKVAYFDHLTGAYNFSYFMTLGERYFIDNKCCSVAVLNIHQFKFFNEIFGHDLGDQLLCHEKKVIENNLHDGEFFCRDTADQFYVFLCETEESVLLTRLNQMMEEIIEYMDLLHSNYHLKIHCGVAISSEELIVDNCFEDLMVRVMFALAKSKETILSNIWFYDIELHKQEIMDNYIESHMEQALKDGEFQLYLQPKVDMETGQLQSSEALVRWITQDNQQLYPNQFIPIFEKSGFCMKLDMYMFEQACLQIRKWMDQGIEPIGISVNQSKLLFYESDYVERLNAIVQKYQVPAHLLTLEILEDLVINNVDEVNEKIEQLHQIGFKVSMDDFGSGYSSLNILGKIDIDELKIDRIFLQEILDGKNKKAQIILEEIIKLTKILSISTVVEGIETKEYHDFVKSLGCHYGQGYYYDRPISQQEFEIRYMKERR